MLKLIDRVQLDEDDDHHWPMLDDLQCNILSSHGRPNTHYFLLRFLSTDPDAVKPVLAALAGVPTTMQTSPPPGLGLVSEYRSRARRLRGKRDWAARAYADEPAILFPNLLLSARCYQDFLKGFNIPPDEAFNRGLVGRDALLPEAAKLHDRRWNVSERGGPFHALFMVGFYPKDPDKPEDLNDPDKIDWEAWQALRADIRKYLDDNSVEVREEAGYVLRHPTENHPIEPFGYRDAISQPLFFREDLEKPGVVRDGVQGPALAPLKTVLVDDPNGATEQSWGTYFVYRKLKQNVADFYAQAAELAELAPPRPDGTPLEREDVADGLIGRKVNGDPLDPDPPADKNDFRFSADTVCPVHAHVRKVNPREEYALPYRIVRRSTVYGPRYERTPDGRPDLTQRDPAVELKSEFPDGVGLMFFCCQSNISEQFETIQGQWANARAGGADAVIGQVPQGEQNVIGVNGSGIKFGYRPVVELLEGEYFFAPSLSFFSKL